MEQLQIDIESQLLLLLEKDILYYVITAMKHASSTAFPKTFPFNTSPLQKHDTQLLLMDETFSTKNLCFLDSFLFLIRLAFLFFQSKPFPLDKDMYKGLIDNRRE